MSKWFTILKRHRMVLLAALLIIVMNVGFYLEGGAAHKGADFGGYSGGSDYSYSGGFDNGSSYDYDFGSYDYGDDDYDDDYGGGSGGSGYSYTPGNGYTPIITPGLSILGTVADIVVELIILTLIIFVMAAIKRKKQNGGFAPADAQHDRAGYAGNDQSRVKLKPISAYSQIDPAFDQEKLKTKLSNLYVQMQHAWTAGNLDSLRPYFTDSFWSQMDNQLQALKQSGRTNYVDNIAVMAVDLLGYTQNDHDDIVAARISTRITDYTLDDRTGNLVSGSKDREKFMVYEYTLTRTKGMTSDKEEEMTVLNCPNCGAPLKINASAQCPYCGSVITVENHGFVISQIRALSQRTGR